MTKKMFSCALLFLLVSYAFCIFTGNFTLNLSFFGIR